MSNEIYSFNWYPKDLPDKDDTVVVRKINIDDMGVWVDLLEYGCIKGFIPLAYATKSPKLGPKTIKIGKVVLATVSQVDEEKHNIDLTRHSLREEDVKNAEKRFYDYRKLMKILLHISNKVGKTNFYELIKNVVYPLHQQYGNAYQALLKSHGQKNIINELSISKEIKSSLFEQIERIFHQAEIRILALFEAEVYRKEGVELLRQALVSGYELESDMKFDNPFSDSEKLNKKPKLFITIVRPPLYSISIDVYNAEQGIDFVNKVLRKIELKIKQVNGRFEVKEEPKVFKQADLEKNKVKNDRFGDDTDGSYEEI